MRPIALRNDVFYRLLTPRWAYTPLSGEGAAKQGGRFNRPGVEALYLSREVETAVAEFKQDNPWLKPGTICSYCASLVVLDLTTYDVKTWPPIWADYQIDWRREVFNLGVEPVTWIMGDIAMEMQADGILFPSQAHEGGTNLVVFNSSDIRGGGLDVIDPDGDLPQDGSSWKQS